MIRRVLVVCLLANAKVLASPQRVVQLGGPQPRPVTVGLPQQGTIPYNPYNPYGQRGPSYSQQITFGGQPQLRQQFPSPTPYQPQQPILLSQTPASINQATFQSFPSSPRSPVILKSPGQSPTATSLASDEEYEYEEEDEPQRAIIQSTARPIQRQPVRFTTPQTIIGQAPQRFAIPQSPAPQQVRRPVQQQRPISPSPQPIQQQSRVPISSQVRANTIGQDGRRNRPTPPPVQTVNRYMKNNDDGSITWGYENEDGTFKEETIGADCVVRGRYGYVDPEGNKREYEYQSGNPCDPNKRGQEEEEEEELVDGPNQQQRLAGILSARPQQLQQRPQPLQQRPQPLPQRRQQPAQYQQPQ